MISDEAPPLELIRYPDARSFLQTVGDRLRAVADLEELPLSIAEEAAAAEVAGGPPTSGLFAHLGPPSEPLAILVMLPGHPLCLAQVRHDFADLAPALAHALVDTGAELPAVIGPPDPVDEFTAAWTAATGAAPSATITETLFRADRIAAEELAAEGRLVRGTVRDRQRIAEWLDAAAREALPAEVRQDAAALADAMVGAGSAYLWMLRDEPRGMGMIFRESSRGATIGGILVPPPFRGRGIATALVAELTRGVLQRKRFCLLHATEERSRLYTRLGFRPLTDVRTRLFASPEPH